MPMLVAGKTPQTVRRLTDGAAEVLERLSGEAMSACQINLIALDAVAKAFGERWAAKRSQVYDHVDRVLARVLSGYGYSIRVSQTDFLVVQAETGEFGAQARCCRCFDEIWTHFLGQLPHQGRSVHRVTELTGDSIVAVEVDPAAALAGEAREHEAAAEAQRLAAEEATSLLSAHRWTPFVASNGRRVDVSCQLEPVFNLKTYSRIALRLRRQVFDVADDRPLSRQTIAGLSRSDLFRIDMACASRGRSRLLALTNAPEEPALVVPASYIAMAHPASRQTFVGALRELKGAAAQGVIIEVHDIDGAPHAGLTEVLSILRRECLLVAGHLAEPPSKSLKDVGLQALSISCPRGLEGEAQFLGWLQAWTRAAHRVSRSLMVYRCESSRRMALAGLVGATHASGLVGEVEQAA
ncbi:MAG TPA: hypothetical protein VFN88_01535 [Caulobacteraceae bacterium]|nr:hypothetical protein [Caulobacteraceae bacterium]